MRFAQGAHQHPTENPVTAMVTGLTVIGGGFAQEPVIIGLRGVFLRGLNRFDPGESKAEAVDEKQRGPGEPKREKAGVLQEWSVGAHQHTFRGGGARAGARGEGGDDLHHLWDGGDWPQRDARPTEGGPKGESRPTNVSVFYYVKIN